MTSTHIDGDFPVVIRNVKSAEYLQQLLERFSSENEAFPATNYQLCQPVDADVVLSGAVKNDQRDAVINFSSLTDADTFLSWLKSKSDICNAAEKLPIEVFCQATAIVDASLLKVIMQNFKKEDVLCRLKLETCIRPRFSNENTGLSFASSGWQMQLVEHSLRRMYQEAINNGYSNAYMQDSNKLRNRSSGNIQNYELAENVRQMNEDEAAVQKIQETNRQTHKHVANKIERQTENSSEYILPEKQFDEKGDNISVKERIQSFQIYSSQEKDYENQGDLYVMKKSFDKHTSSHVERSTSIQEHKPYRPHDSDDSSIPIAQPELSSDSEEIVNYANIRSVFTDQDIDRTLHNDIKKKYNSGYDTKDEKLDFAGSLLTVPSIVSSQHNPSNSDGGFDSSFSDTTETKRFDGNTSVRSSARFFEDMSRSKETQTANVKAISDAKTVIYKNDSDVDEKSDYHVISEERHPSMNQTIENSDELTVRERTQAFNYDNAFDEKDITGIEYQNNVEKQVKEYNAKYFDKPSGSNSTFSNNKSKTSHRPMDDVFNRNESSSASSASYDDHSEILSKNENSLLYHRISSRNEGQSMQSKTKRSANLFESMAAAGSSTHAINKVNENINYHQEVSRKTSFKHLLKFTQSKVPDPNEEKVTSQQKQKKKVESTTKPICDKCPGCFNYTKLKLPKCDHYLCAECEIRQVKANGPICPTCREPTIDYTQPKNGEMLPPYRTSSIRLPGHKQYGTLIIEYRFEAGVQKEYQPNPGRPYAGIERKAYFPDTEEAKWYHEALVKAFDARQTFKINENGELDWNIPHKTSTTSKHECGYPDKNYFSTLREGLVDLGIIVEGAWEEHLKLNQSDC